MKQILIEWDQYRTAQEQLAIVTQEWKTGRYQELLIHIYSGLEEESITTGTAGKVQSACPYAKIMGTMSAGEIMDGREIRKGILVSAILFESTSVQVLRFDHVRGRETEVGTKLCRKLEEIPDVKGMELLLPGLEMDTRKLFGALEKSRREIQIFGGYSGGHQLNSPAHYVFNERETFYDSVYAAIFSGKDFHIDVGKVIGWDTMGLPFRVTRAEGNRLVELDGRPASEVYERFLQIDRTQWDNAEAGYEFPLMARYNGEEWLRSTVHIEENGALNLHGYVVEGMEIYLSYGNPSRIVDLVNERLVQVRQFQPQVILLYSCIVRRQFWENLVNMEMEPFAMLGSTGGFHTWGEISRNTKTGEIFEHNVTLLSIAMREGERSGKVLPAACVDDTVLRGQASLLKRLASLINTTMKELRVAHDHLQEMNRKLAVMAEHDALTGLYNRGKIEQLINKKIDAASMLGETTSLVMVDVDYFKQINDTYGHETGDAVLQSLAELLRHSVSLHEGAEAGRWGGEEFFLVFPGLSEPEVYETAESLRKSVEFCRFPSAEHVTISLGVITVTGGEERKQIYAKVDDALYQAKSSGRNRTERASLLPPVS